MRTTSSKTLIASHEEELAGISESLLEFAGDHRIIAFFGEMGSGKTTFIKYVCRTLKVTGKVTSPTFALVNEYQTIAGEPVYHFDFYRINSEKEAVDIGLEEYFQSGHYCLIEWPEKILNLLPQPVIRVFLRVENESRLLTFSI